MGSSKPYGLLLWGSVLHPFWKTFSPCNLMQWKLTINWKNKSRDFHCFFVSVSSLWWTLSTPNTSYTVSNESSFFGAIWSWNTKKVSLMMSWKQHRQFIITSTLEAPGDTWRRRGHRIWTKSGGSVPFDWQRVVADLGCIPQPSSSHPYPKNTIQALFQDPLSRWYALERDSMPYSSSPF